MQIMSRDRVILLFVGVSVFLQLGTLWQLVAPVSNVFTSPVVWLSIHCVTAVLYGLSSGYWLGLKTALNPISVAFLMGVMALCMPGIGGVAALVSIVVANKIWLNRSAESTDFVVTENTPLPFTTPIGRKATLPDSRGFVEQLRYSSDTESLYQKVLSSGNIRNSISVSVLREAVTHSDERIRLTAYQILDRKVNELNAEIQRLEAHAVSVHSDSRGITWLQVANNYWELLTLERGDAVARAQLLKKAIQAASNSVAHDSKNRNAYLVLGRVCLEDRNVDLAAESLQQSIDLGMPRDKVVPYLAEAAFGRRDFKKVKQLLASLDDAFKQCPPLKQVVEYWA